MANRCGLGERLDRGMCVPNTRLIGDGKMPNLYFVAVHNNYLHESEPGSWDWGLDESIYNVEGKTLKVFKTYADARRFFDQIGMEDTVQGVQVRGKTIEDRLSGEIADETMYEYLIPEVPAHVEMRPEFHEDTRFTRETMEKRGRRFE